jgi:hypothetical protein
MGNRQFNRLHLLADILGRLPDLVKNHTEAVAQIAHGAACVFSNWADRVAESDRAEREEEADRQRRWAAEAAEKEGKKR